MPPPPPPQPASKAGASAITAPSNLLASIQKGAKLKKTITDDRSSAKGGEDDAKKNLSKSNPTLSNAQSRGREMSRSSAGLGLRERLDALEGERKVRAEREDRERIERVDRERIEKAESERIVRLERERAESLNKSPPVVPVNRSAPPIPQRSAEQPANQRFLKSNTFSQSKEMEVPVKPLRLSQPPRWSFNLQVPPARMYPSGDPFPLQLKKDASDGTTNKRNSRVPPPVPSRNSGKV